ncbi:hypothetical protein KR067_009219, partial [Drosophila pandora]
MPPEMQITSDSDLDNVLEEFKLRNERRNSTGTAKYTCSIEKCDATFKRLDQLDRHEYHHTGIKKHACSHEGCDKTYSILTHLKRHLRSTHERPEAAAQKTFKCSLPECTKMFTSSCNMQRHVREAHEKPRVYPCGHCPAKFSQKLKLKRHEIKEHTQDYPFRCQKCSRGFYQEWQRESHQGTCKLYACPACPLKFEKWTLYTKHCRDTLHGKNRHKCDQCNSCYDKPSDLKQHIEAKHKKAESSEFTCPEEGCSKSYSYERNLRQHVLTAHSGRRFECQALDCGRCFSSAQNLSKHVLRDHQDGKTNKKKVPGNKEEASPGKKTNPRKRRRDAGRPKHSRLSKLACLQLGKEEDLAVRERQPLALEKVTKELEKDTQELDEVIQETEAQEKD